MAHDLEESLPRARAVLIVGRSAQLFHVLFEQGDGFSRGIATSCSHLEVLLSPPEVQELLDVKEATVGKVNHTLVVVEVHVHRDKDQLDGLEVVVHGAAHVEEGHQDALNYQDKHDCVQPVVQGRQKSHLVQDWQASHHKLVGLVVLHKTTDHKDQVVGSHVDWDMGVVGHDPKENLPIEGAAVVVGTI